MVLGKVDNYMQKNEIRTLANTIYKDKWIKDLNVRNYETLRGKQEQFIR